MVRLDLALIRAHAGMSRRKARDVIEKGQVTVAGETVREAGRMVAEEAAIAWDPSRKALPRARSSLPILHQDDAVLVVDKPAGLLTVPSLPGAGAEDTALARVEDYVRHLRPRHPYVGVVHRIDRDTSGAVAFALSPPAREALRALFRAHRIERRYLALVRGQPRGDGGVVEAPLHEDYRDGRRRVARRGEPSRPALTRFTVLERFPGAALLELELGTGRQHQIRVHLAHLGTPVLGDPVYGAPGAGPTLPRIARQMLHARLLAFEHPLTGAAVRAESPLPGDFARVLAELRRQGGRSSPRIGPRRAKR
jgi:23S rRNA pseudouridine1911/1915/1917 synthase